MGTKTDDAKVDTPTKAPAIEFESVYIDSAPKLRNPEHLVHYELGKSGDKHGIRITSKIMTAYFLASGLTLDNVT